MSRIESESRNRYREILLGAISVFKMSFRALSWPLRALNISPIQFYRFIAFLAVALVWYLESFRLTESVRAPSDKYNYPEWFSNPAYANDLTLPLCTEMKPTRQEVGRGATCPKGYAVLGNSDSGALLAFELPIAGDASRVKMNAICCRLPARKILDYRAKEVWTEDFCPADHIATGESDKNCIDDCKIRCTKINTAKYKIGSPQPSLYWRKGFGGASSGRGTARQIDFEDIPLAIRFAFRFQDKYSLPGDGCVGFPFGSVLVGKRKPGCGGYYYAQLLQKYSLEPVPMFPNCQAIRGLYGIPSQCEINPLVL